MEKSIKQNQKGGKHYSDTSTVAARRHRTVVEESQLSSCVLC